MKPQLSYLLLGSNVGHRENHLHYATELLVAAGLKMLRQSSIYETEAWGKTNQPLFLNQCVEVETLLKPQQLLQICKEVEQKIGRKKRAKWMEREIDIDILLFANQKVELPHLSIPHKQLIRRRFALLPLAELSGSYMHPIYKLSINDLLKLCTDELNVYPK